MMAFIQDGVVYTSADFPRDRHGNSVSTDHRVRDMPLRMLS